jgi:FkbM family methyltransferase
VDDAHGLMVSLITLGDPGTLTGGYLYHRRVAALASRFGACVRFVSVPAAPFPLPVAAGPWVLRQVARQRPDVVLLDSIAAGYLAPWLPFRRPATPVAAILHQPPGGIDHPRARTSAQAVLDRWAYRAASRLLVASAALADDLVAAGLPRDRMTVVPPGRDVASSPGPSPGDLRHGRRAALLSVGNWVARKGLLDLLEAVSRLPDDAMTLHLVGDPDVEPGYAARVRARLAAPDLAGRVVVHGPVTVAQVAAFYGAADVFALASSQEPYGTVYGEAMAAGLPVVGYAAGNLPHLARGGEEGLVVPPGDVAALTAALRRLADDEGLRTRLGAAAARRAATFPTWEDTAALLFAELRALARESPPARRKQRPVARSVARAVVGRMPVPVADAVRRPLPADVSSSGRLRRSTLRALREGGIPRGVSTFRLVDNPDLAFVSAESLVLSQLYWYGEEGWEPELLPWWRWLCRHSESVLELGANVGYFTVQAAMAAPGVRQVAVEPHPYSLQICRANLALNRVSSVEVIGAAAVVDPAVSSVRLLVPGDQLATPTVAFLPSDSELPAEMAHDVTAAFEVPAVDVRKLLADADLVKLDVEGQEHTLLAAGRDLVRERRPTLVVEVLPGTPRLRALLADLCRQDGYRCYAVTRERPVELAPARLATVLLQQEFGCQDVILRGTEPPWP